MFWNFNLLFYVYWCFCLHGYLYIMYVHCLWRQPKGVRAHETWVIDGCELPCELWELNPSSLEEQTLLLTAVSPGPAASNLTCIFLKVFNRSVCPCPLGLNGYNPELPTPIWEKQLTLKWWCLDMGSWNSNWVMEGLSWMEWVPL